MLRNFKKEMEDTRDRLFEALRNINIARQFGTKIILNTIYLSLTERRIRNAQNLNERRKRINEFDRAKTEIEKGIVLLRDCIARNKENRSIRKRQVS
jgi:hypothetical protein